MTHSPIPQALHDLAPGLANPVLDSQVTFRALLHSMSRPGTIMVPGTVRATDSALAPPAPLTPAAAAVCLTLADLDTPLWLGPDAPQPLCTYLRFHCGCPLTDDPGNAAFAVLLDGTNLPDLELFSKGDQEYPDRSTTLIVQVAALEPGTGPHAGPGTGMRLTGPGVKGETFATVLGVAPEFWPAIAANHRIFPKGWDVIFATEDEILCLPRSTKVEV